MIGGGPKEKREVNDFYPTPIEVTHAFMQWLKIGSGAFIREPCCGDGMMSKVIESYGHNVYSSDIVSSGYGTSGVDFLISPPVYCDAIITNPPFNLAEKVIRRALFQAPLVAVVLKATYWHAKTRQELFKEYPPAYILPLTWRPDFMGGGAPTMDFMWTLWRRGDTVTKYQPLDKPDLYLL